MKKILLNIITWVLLISIVIEQPYVAKIAIFYFYVLAITAIIITLIVMGNKELLDTMKQQYQPNKYRDIYNNISTLLQIAIIASLELYLLATVYLIANVFSWMLLIVIKDLYKKDQQLCK